MVRLREADGRLRVPDARIAVGLALVAVSVFGGLRLSGASTPSTSVLTVRSSIASGHRLAEGDLGVAEVHVDDRVLRTLLPANLRRQVIGRITQHGLRAGGLLDASSLTRRRGASREVTVPVTPEHALGGVLEAGDRVDLLATFDTSSDAARTITVTGGAEVVSVVRGDQVFGGAGALSAVTLAVPADDAMFVVYAMRSGQIDLLRSAEVESGRTRFDGTEVP